MEFQIVRTTDPLFPFFWRMVDDVGRMLTYSSARYRSSEECVDAVREVQREAGAAPVVDLSGAETEAG